MDGEPIRVWVQRMVNSAEVLVIWLKGKNYIRVKLVIAIHLFILIHGYNWALGYPCKPNYIHECFLTFENNFFGLWIIQAYLHISICAIKLNAATNFNKVENFLSNKRHLKVEIVLFGLHVLEKWISDNQFNFLTENHRNIRTHMN